MSSKTTRPKTEDKDQDTTYYEKKEHGRLITASIKERHSDGTVTLRSWPFGYTKRTMLKGWKPCPRPQFSYIGCS